MKCHQNKLFNVVYIVSVLKRAKFKLAQKFEHLLFGNFRNDLNNTTKPLFFLKYTYNLDTRALVRKQQLRKYVDFFLWHKNRVRNSLFYLSVCVQ